jgi:very-short-patch-repair endonuclease
VAQFRLTPEFVEARAKRLGLPSAVEVRAPVVTPKKIITVDLDQPIVKPKKKSLPNLGSQLEQEFDFQLRAAKCPAFVREHRFMLPDRQYRFDFCWKEFWLAVELDGGTWLDGGHNRGKQIESDCVKLAEAILRGWVVLRFTTDMVKDGRALNYTKAALWERK